MNDRAKPVQARIPAGLCDGCRHARLVTSARGSQFLLCALSATDARFPKYPRLPVVACDGFAPDDAPGGAGAGTGRKSG